MTTKRRLIKHLPILIAGFAMGLGVFSYSKLSKQPEVQETEASASSYWASVNTSANASTLFNKLYTLINTNTTTISYDGLWDAYKKTDIVPGTSKIWDMYGGFQFTYQSGGKSYSKEGDCYNREHSIPKSWWNKTEDERYSDIVHLLPTDGYVNNRRSNYAFGEVSSATYTWTLSERKDGANNVIQTTGYSKLGTAKSINGVSYPGSDPVFEPADQYKGDFARIYYYFANRYGPKNKIATSGDGSHMFSSNANDFYLTSYGRALLNKWHVQDPVSQKELTRNDGIEQTQGNRNPYVDHPEWADKIFGSNYEATHGTIDDDTPRISISASATTMAPGESVTLTATTENVSGTVQWYIEDSSTNIIQLSSSSGNSITVNGIAIGTKTVFAYVGTVSDSIDITVSSSGSGEVSGGEGLITFGSGDGDLNVNSASVSGDDNLENTWTVTTTGTTSYTSNADYAQIGSSSKPASTITFTTTLPDEMKISAFSATFGGFNGTKGDIVLKVGSTTVGSGSLNASTDVTVQATDKNKVSDTLTVSVSNIDKGVKVYSISYTCESSSTPAVTLSSISIKTSPTKLTYTEGEYFNPSGLVINRIYSDSTSDTYTYSGHENEFIFNPSLSIALTTLDDNVEIGYGEKSCELTITVNPLTIDSISASVSKTYFVGEEITSSDITVKDNNNNVVSSFTFSNDGYKFTYADAASGGNLTTKTFTNAISGANKTCSLTVQVQRKAFVAPSVQSSDLITRATTGITAYSSFANWSNKTLNSGAVYAGHSARYGGTGNTNDAIQLRATQTNNTDYYSGIISTSSGGKLRKISVQWNSNTTNGRAITIYGKNSAYSSPNDLFSNDASVQGTSLGTITKGTNIEITVSGTYTFVGIRAGGALYLDSITIDYGSSSDAKNVSNYIMFEDTNNQCLSKLSVAIGYLHDLDSTERGKFVSPTDYVISKAKERLEAWAVSQGKTVNYTDGSLNPARTLVEFGIQENNSTIIMLVIISMVGVSTIAACLYIRKKRSR